MHEEQTFNLNFINFSFSQLISFAPGPGYQTSQALFASMSCVIKCLSESVVDIEPHYHFFNKKTQFLHQGVELTQIKFYYKSTFFGIERYLGDSTFFVSTDKKLVSFRFWQTIVLFCQ